MIHCPSILLKLLLSLIFKVCVKLNGWIKLPPGTEIQVEESSQQMRSQDAASSSWESDHGEWRSLNEGQGGVLARLHCFTAQVQAPEDGLCIHLGSLLCRERRAAPSPRGNRSASASLAQVRTTVVLHKGSTHGFKVAAATGARLDDQGFLSG